MLITRFILGVVLVTQFHTTQTIPATFPPSENESVEADDSDFSQRINRSKRESLPASDLDIAHMFHIPSAADMKRMAKKYRNQAEPDDASPCLTPKFMLDLYERKKFANTYVRGFLNLNTDKSSWGQRGKHTLVFNISSLNLRESIQSAELRLFVTLITKGSKFPKASGDITINEVQINNQREISKHQLLRRKIQPKSNGWQIFSLTHMVHNWVRSKRTLRVLEVSVTNSNAHSVVDIDIRPRCDREPLLVIFSDAKKRISRTFPTYRSRSHTARGRLTTRKSYHVTRLPIRATHKYSTYSENLHHRSAISDPKTRRKRRSREKRRRRYRKNICRIKPLTVKFEDINWENFVIAPKSYMANECVGKCFYPIASHLNPSKYAIIKTLLHGHRPREVARACCVPTKLDPISLLYVDENAAIVYEYAFSEMVVKECGCR